MPLSRRDLRKRSAVVVIRGRILYWQAHDTPRYNRGYRMLVHHLADGVLQQHDELIEGFNLALQLDAVDQVDGNRDPLFSQQVQVRVL